MAQDVFNKEEYPGISRINSYLVDPRELKPDPILNGRVELPDVEKFKRDFLDPTIGQIQPITIKKINGEPLIVDGVSRWRAALDITEAKQGPHEGGVFKLLCRYFVAKSPVDYFIATIKANIRNDPKPEDDAHNISILMHNFQMTEEDIASRVYARFTIDNKPDVKWVQDRAALSNLTDEGMAALKAGKLKPKAAVELAKKSAKIQRQKLKAAESGTKLTVASIRREEDTPVAPQATAKPVWTLRRFRDLVQERIDGDIRKSIKGLDAENAVRVVLGELLDNLK